MEERQANGEDRGSDDLKDQRKSFWDKEKRRKLQEEELSKHRAR